MAIPFKVLKETSKKTYKKSRGAMPFMLTFANALCGCFVVVKALDGDMIAATYGIFAAAVLDLFDGRLARAFGVASGLGMELDSLCDAISFCVAPTMLLYGWRLHTFGYLGIVVLAVYLCAGLLRLAKFNLTSDKQGHFFIGLPTPVAALFVATLVRYHAWVDASSAYFLASKHGLLVLVLFLAWLMVSSVRFPTFKG